MTTPAPARHRAVRQPPPRGGRRVARRARPRYGRLAAFATAFVVTSVSVGAGVGLIPSEPGRTYAATPRGDSLTLSAVTGEGVGASAATTGRISPQPAEDPAVVALPADSGAGRRIVFDQSDQRVWLVRRSGKVARTYLVSGSLTDNLEPGTYSVYSKSRWAVGIEDSGVMQYFVRFAHGDTAAIGFHTIPTKAGDPLQTTGELGTPQSHGCIRQDTPDAIALWKFAPVGTTVVVTA